VLRFRGTLDVTDRGQFCAQFTDPDCENAVTVTGTLADDGGGIVARDEARTIDTDRERQANADDNVVTANILCRGLGLLKEVRLLPGGPFVTGDEQLDIPNDFPVDIEYRYTIDNTGEVDEDITLTDQFLCDDVAKTTDVNVVAGQCAICPSGELTDTIPAGQPRSYTCQVRFLTRDALRNFLQQDDKPGHEDCRVPDAEKDPDNCYRNCASASGDVPDRGQICPDGTIETNESFTDVCNEGTCTVNVTKQVRCLPDCDKNALGAEVGWVEDPALLEVAPGACLQYRIIVENMDKDGSLGQTAVCALEFNDLMTDKGNFVGGPANVQSHGDATCANANFATDFNWNGTDVVCELDQPLEPGESTTVLFEARLSSNANSALDPVNTVEVRGAT
jgi:hypothetical protein